MKPLDNLALITDAEVDARVSRATIVEARSQRRVVLRPSGAATATPALVAVHGYHDPQEGDEVLAVTGGDETYVIGVIRALREAPARPEPSYEARDAQGRLLFRHDPETGTSEVFVGAGDLRFNVDQGRLELRARDGVTIDSDEKLELRSHRGLELRAESPSGSDSATIVINPDRIGTSAAELLVAAGRAQLAAAQAVLTATDLQTTVARAQHVARVVETKAHRIVEQSKDSFREVERVAQVKAGRLRSIARTSAQVLAERVLVRSKKDLKLRGEKIYLS